MIEEAISALLKEGVGWTVAVLLGAVIIFLDRRVAKLQAQCEQQAASANKAVQEQYEKRLEEFRELIEVMSNQTQTVKAMHGSLAATTEAINQLAQGFAKLLSEFQSQQSRWDDRGGAMAKQLEDIRSRLEALQREVRAA